MKIQTNSKRRGQGMTEYIIIVAMIAIAAIISISFFGDNIRHLFGMSTDALAGNTTERRVGANVAEETHTLQNFNQ